MSATGLSAAPSSGVTGVAGVGELGELGGSGSLSSGAPLHDPLELDSSSDFNAVLAQVSAGVSHASTPTPLHTHNHPPPLPPIIHAASGPWQPPAPSLAALPVDRSKTEPKPAYYKLQFGDDVTGFSYYVRTLSVVIGRGVVSKPFVFCVGAE